MELILVKLMDEFDADNYSPCIVELLESEHRLHAGFDASMILFHHIVQVLAGADPDRILASEIELIPHAHASQR